LAAITPGMVQSDSQDSEGTTGNRLTLFQSAEAGRESNRLGWQG
jgi:hypothetical protein